MDIQKIKKLYDQNQNLTEYFKTSQNKDCLNSQEIELIYDLQSGNYINGYKYDKSHREYKDKFTDEIINHINNLDFKFDSILEAGIGEGTTFINVIQKLNNPKLKSFGLDISWSRLAYANKFLKKHSIKNTKLVTGLLENLPFLENSIDIVYTAHSIEPNGGKEKEILKELFRVTKNYLILLEPSYVFGDNEQKERMNRLSYAKNLNKYCKELEYKIIKHKLLKNHSAKNNKTEIIIIEKSTKKTKTRNFLACPESKTKLFKNKNFYYSEESFYSYPILESIACLNSENKILCTKLDKFIKLNKLDPRYNQQMFLESLEEPIDVENIKNMYSPNCIGFLVTKENLQDKEFIKYLNQIIKNYSNCTFKAFYLDKNLIKEIKENFKQNNNFKILELRNIKTIFLNLQIYLGNFINKLEMDLANYLILNSENIVCIPLNFHLNQNVTIQEFSNSIQNYYYNFFENIELFGYEKKDIEVYGKDLIQIIIKNALNKYNIKLEINMQDTIRKLIFITLSIGLANNEYFKNIINIETLNTKLRNNTY